MATSTHWALLDLTWTGLLDGFRITAETNIPCHLFMSWSLIPPRKHDVAIVIRGLPLAKDPYYCMAAPHDNEQAEPGDTLIHTFDKRNWPVCQTRYFYFWAEIHGLTSPSTTAIFSLHRLDTDIPITTPWLMSTVDNRTLWYSHGTWPVTHDSPTGTIGPWHDPPSLILFSGERLTASYFIWRSILHFDTSLIPVGSYIDGWVLSLYCTAKLITSSLILPNLQVTQGVQDTPVIPADYGGQLAYTVVGGQIDIRDITLGVRNEITSTDDGRGFIVPGGLTRLCLRTQQDVQDTAPPLGENSVAYSSRQAGPLYRPWLKISYIPP